MSESITQRVKRIIAGGAHALAETVEALAPEAMMEQAVRELDGVLDEVRAELGRVLANKHLATRRLAEENEKHESLAGKVELALAEGRDDLAEVAIAQQLDIEAQLPVLEQSLQDAATAERELEGFLSALGGKRREMLGELEAFRAVRSAAPSPGPAAPYTARASRAEQAFDRLMHQHSGMPPHPAAAAGEAAAKLAELEELQRRHRIQERLAAMKAHKE